MRRLAVFPITHAAAWTVTWREASETATVWNRSIGDAACQREKLQGVIDLLKTDMTRLTQVLSLPA